MIVPDINKALFNFNYLPDYAKYLLNNKLEEFVTVNIRFSREAELPILKPLSKLSEGELVKLSMDSTRKQLEALSAGQITLHIEDNARQWVQNSMGVVERDEIVAEDITLLSFIRRKLFTYFLDAYTKNVVLHKFIISEVDVYTTQEELISYTIYLALKQEKLIALNKELAMHRDLLLEAQFLGNIGSFLINFKDQSKSIITPEYQRIFEMDSVTSFEEFMKNVHADDRSKLAESISGAYKHGGHYEVEYRFNKTKEKKIWSKGFIETENGKPYLIRGIVKEVNTL